MTNPDDDSLSALLGALRQAQSVDAAPAHVEAALMKAWDTSHAPPVSAFALGATADKSSVRLSAASQAASLAAVAVLAVSLTVLGGRLRSGTAVAPSRAAEPSPTVILVGEPMLDGEQIRLVRMRIPASALHALGVTSTAPPTDDVDVDIIVGEDGVARALSLNP